MKIRRAKKSDLKKYLELRRKWEEESAKINKRKVELKDRQIKKEFSEIMSNKKRILLVVEQNQDLIGFLIATLIRNIYSKNNCFMDDIFIDKEFRKQGLAIKLMKEFMKLLKTKKINGVLLGVRLTNKKAQKLYKKLGFKMTGYEMEKNVKK